MSFWQWIDETKLWHWVAKNVFAKWTFRIRPLPLPSENLQSEFYLAASSALRDPNSMLCFVCQDKWAFGSMLIRMVSKSQWSHSGFIHIYSKAIERVDVRSTGFCTDTIFSLLRNYDRVALVKIPVSKKHICNSNLLYYACNQDKISYDWEQELKDDNTDPEVNHVYCSELVWLVCKGQAELKCSQVMGRKVFSPDDVAKSGTIIWSHTR